MPQHATWTTFLMRGIGFALAAVVVLASIPVLFGSPLPVVRVYWGDVAVPNRIAAERQFQLSEPTHVRDNVWSYVPLDTSRDTLRAIVTHPSVEDTDGINRRTFQIADRPPLTPRRGGVFSGAPPLMARAVRLLAYALACLSVALLFRAGSTSPLLGPDSRLRRRLGALHRMSWSALRALPSAVRSGIRGVTVRTTVTIAVAAMFVATLAWRLLTFTGFSNDHYAHLALAQQMLLGDRPIRDFADPGWPLTYLLTAAGWMFAGDALATEWTITALGFALGAAFTVGVAYQLSGSVVIAVVVSLLEIAILPRSYSYPKMLVYGAGAWVILRLAAEPSRRWIVLTALMVAIAFLFRHDHGLFIGVASAASLALATRADGWRVAIGRVALLTVATAAFLLPWTLFVVLNGGLIDYFQSGIEYSVGEAAATRLRAWPRLALGPFDLKNAEAWLFWLFWSLPLACAVIAWRRARANTEQWRGEHAAVGGLVVVSLLVNASFVREALQVRLTDAIVPAALLGAWALGACWSGTWHRPGHQRLAQLVAVVCVLLTGIAVSRIAGLPDQYDNTGIRQGPAGVRARAAEVSALLRQSHRQDTPSRYSIALAPFFGYLDRCTSRSERLIVTGEFPDVVVLAGRRFSGDGVVFGAWYSSSLHQDRTLVRMEAEPALFALHMGDYEAFQNRFGLIDRYVNEAYEPMATIPVENGGTIRVLVLQRRQAAGVDAETGWPCFAPLDRPRED